MRGVSQHHFSVFDKKSVSGILIRLDCYVICDHKTPDVYLRNNPLGIWVGASRPLCPCQLMQPRNPLSNVQREKKKKERQRLKCAMSGAEQRATGKHH